MTSARCAKQPLDGRKIRKEVGVGLDKEMVVQVADASPEKVGGGVLFLA
jgi:hypothetical protein